MKPLFAALSLELPAGVTPSGRVRLFPAGTFRGLDGRPKECTAWVMNAVCAQRLINQVNNQKTELCFDYEHQTLRAMQNGKPAPASGWFKSLEWVEGDGLYATDVRWTDAASAMICAREYRYISPWFRYSATTGEVLSLVNVALTNIPALDDLDEVAQAAACRLAALSQTPSEQETSPMDEEQISNLLANLRWIFNLPETATAEDIKAEIDKVITAMSGGQGTAATSQGLMPWIEAKDNQLTEQTTAMAALSAIAYDPAKHVPIEALNDALQRLAQAERANAGHQVNDVVQAALSDGRLLPSMEDWARQLGQKDMTALQTYLDNATPLAALSQLQTGGAAPSGAVTTKQQQDTGVTALDDEAQAICSSLGLDPQDMAQEIAAITGGH
ncbi:phage protease [Salmonella enterica]|nr:hypothetical protein [Salmonella enterica subsp. enterica]EBP5354269.1 hypothetical protein [Salmonella enterica]EGR8150727.1 hypothetical protein [Salmonella enterica subsp. enterica serovar Adelaide]MBA6279844.1 phage protease [Salmonella enterica subsp. enterica serovar Irumu]EIK9522706.1 phage protease [Salmonella enterica]